MALIIEDGSIVEDANSYISVAEFKAYHDARGIEYDTFTDDQIEYAIIKAMDYIHLRWGSKFKGRIKDAAQQLDFPRVRLYDSNGRLVDNIPGKLKDATSEYSMRALTEELIPDPAFNTAGLSLKRTREKIGPIEEETEYNPGSVAIYRKFTKADLLLAEFINSASGVIRG
jgi:hypothetical protein